MEPQVPGGSNQSVIGPGKHDTPAWDGEWWEKFRENMPGIGIFPLPGCFSQKSD